MNDDSTCMDVRILLELSLTMVGHYVYTNMPSPTDVTHGACHCFRRAYLRMSASSEAFFTLRSNFATSHAQVSVCQWVLGIGDRHLSNFMIDTRTGKMVGIDFGHAFGSASQVRGWS